jgi:hypothetical protein
LIWNSGSTRERTADSPPALPWFDFTVRLCWLSWPAHAVGSGTTAEDASVHDHRAGILGDAVDLTIQEVIKEYWDSERTFSTTITYYLVGWKPCIATIAAK